MSRQRLSSRMRGVSLVELMIGLAIGLFLMSLSSVVFLSNKGTFSAQVQASRLQENARFLNDALSTDLRMAGFRGCRGVSGTHETRSVLNTPDAFLLKFSEGVWASHPVSGAFAPALDASLVALNPAPSTAGDVLTVRRAVGAGWGLTAEMTAGTGALQVSQGSALTAQDLLMVSDCAGAVFFQATNATPGTDGAVEHNSAAAVTPGVSSSDLGRAFLQDAVIHRMATTTYYMAPSARTGRSGLKALWSHTSPAYDGSVQPQELVTGVEGFVVTLGLDTDADGGANAYVRPADVTQWDRVVSAQVALLLASTDLNAATAPQPYTFDGTTVTPTDRRLRTVMTTLTSLRNATR